MKGNGGAKAAAVTQILADVHALAGEIGPRPTGKEGEARAAHYVRARLEGLGLAVEEERFRAVSEMNWFPISAAVACILGVGVHPLTPWLGAAIAASAPLLLWSAITRADSPIRFLLPQVKSRNVIARVEAEEDPERAVVIVSHLDTNRCRLVWRAGRADTIERGSFATLLVYGITGALLLIGAASGSDIPWFAAIPGGAYSLATLIFLLSELRRPYSPGANDNASSVAVNLELAGRLAERPLQRTEVRLAFTGAEEVDHRGIKAILVRAPSLRRARFIVLEGLGAGNLSYLVEEGTLARYRPDEGSLRLAEGAAAARPELGAAPVRMRMVDEVQTLRRLGCRAICIARNDPATGSLENWHTCADTVEFISEDALAGAAEFVWEILRRIDEEDE